MMKLLLLTLLSTLSFAEEASEIDEIDDQFCWSGNNCGYYDSADYVYAECGTTDPDFKMRDDFSLTSQCAAVCEACDGCTGFEMKDNEYCIYYEDFGTNWKDWQFGCVLSTTTFTQVICADKSTDTCLDEDVFFKDGDAWNCNNGCGTCTCNNGEVETDYCMVDGNCMEPTCEDVGGWNQNGNTCVDYEDNWCDGKAYTSSHEPNGDDGTKASDSCCACGGGIITKNALCPATSEGEHSKFTCTTWCDGCNTCGMEAGEVTWCTRMFCMNEGDEFCMEYEDGTESDCNCGSTCNEDGTSSGEPPKKPTSKGKGKGKGKSGGGKKPKSSQQNDDDDDCSPVCCMAMTASCLSCAACQTEAEYCAANPTVIGC